MQPGTQRGLATVRYLLDTAASRFTVQAFATGLLSPLGHNPTIAIRDYKSAIDFVPGTYDKAILEVTVNASALEILDELRRDDREKVDRTMYEQVLDVAHFPNIRYESKEVRVRRVGDGFLHVSVTGDLTLRDITRTHSFDAQVQDMGTMLRIAGGFTLRQQEFGIKPVSFAAGALRLKDELKFKFDMVARHDQ